MREKIIEANMPKFDANKLVPANLLSIDYNGFIDDYRDTIEHFNMYDEDVWKRFVNMFRIKGDAPDRGWRGEFWGKQMRGACHVYAYKKDKKLYKVLTNTVLDLLSTQEECGRISSYPLEKELFGWDVWSRKYVLLGLQYFLEICEDEELSKKIIDSMCVQVDYLMSKLGDEEGKRPITEATNHWRGLNSCSLLEPIVRLYRITKEQKHLDFAQYIADCGGTSIVNVFKLAYENDMPPYLYPQTKAYEMTSCFDGLLELYRVTKVEWYKQALINYADRILETDFTVIGCSGCSCEVFDHSTVRQTNRLVHPSQETCVTVTMMKFFLQLTLITGDPKYIDAFERSLYNAYLGAVNNEKVIEEYTMTNYDDFNLAYEPVPFDGYSPLVRGKRGMQLCALKVVGDGHYYGCCAAMGALGIGLVPKMAILRKEAGLALNLYISGELKTTTPGGQEVSINIETEYPKAGDIKIKIGLAKPEKFSLALRNPGWSKYTTITVNGEKIESNPGYMDIERTFENGDVIELSFDMTTRVIRPIPYGSQILMNEPIWGHNYMIHTFDKEDPEAKNHIALQRGPVMLAVDARLGFPLDKPAHIVINEDESVCVKVPDKKSAPYNSIVEFLVPTNYGEYILTTDYASAGKLWRKESEIAVWIKNSDLN